MLTLKSVMLLLVFLFAPAFCVAGEGMNWIKMCDCVTL